MQFLFRLYNPYLLRQSTLNEPSRTSLKEFTLLGRRAQCARDHFGFLFRRSGTSSVKGWTWRRRTVESVKSGAIPFRLDPLKANA